ncbi:MAG: hypothetical protein NTZ69_15915 [Bacteroidia bacterium]|nr:hypothetical protein [Bacteroidia bacterium]
MKIAGLNQAAIDINQGNIEKGFYQNKIEIGTQLMLVVSELSEALEADRKGKHADKNAYNNDIEHHPNKAFEIFIKDTVEDEIADAIIRLLDLSAHKGIDIEWHIENKLAYNKTRAHKHGKSY